MGLKRIKYRKGEIREAYGVKYRVYQHSPNAWFWETRKWMVWSDYPDACYHNAEDANQAATNVLKECAEGSRVF